MRSLWLLGPPRVELHRNTPQNLGKKNKTSDREQAPGFRSRRTVALLGYLVAEQRTVSRDFLAAFLWPDKDPSDGRTSLRRELYNLTRILPDCWDLNYQEIRFIAGDSVLVDIYQVADLTQQQRWEEAAEYLGGEFLEGVMLAQNPEFEIWLSGEKERWREEAEAILKHEIEGFIIRGRYSDALRQVRRLLQQTPWNEQAHQQAMRLLAWTGKRGAAIRQFENCKEALYDELDELPSKETITLYRHIQAGKLDLPPQLPAFLTEERPRKRFEPAPFVGRESELAKLAGFLDLSQKGKGKVVFITGDAGRGKTALLEEFTRKALEIHPRLLVASGKCNAYSGIGDPYFPYRELMDILSGDVESRWDTGAITRDHAQRLWAALPNVVRTILDHGPNLVNVLVFGEDLLSRLEIVQQSEPDLIERLRNLIEKNRLHSGELNQDFLFQQLANTLISLSNSQPLMLILDDIQWADAASISLLFHLGRSLAGIESGILIICAYRPEEVFLNQPNQDIDHVERHPLKKVLNEFKRTFGDIWVDLVHPDENEGRVFVDDLLDTEPNHLSSDFRTKLFDRTEGHPLFIVELLRDLKARGDLAQDREGYWVERQVLDWNVFPARVEAVIEERINRLDPTLLEILNVASVEGEVFSVPVLSGVLDQPDKKVLRLLNEDLTRRHNLVREIEEIVIGNNRINRYRFVHGLFQEYIHSQLGQSEKRLLHGQVATTLEKTYANELDQIAFRLADHFYRAGQVHLAYKYFSLAAERAASLYANNEVVKHCTRAIDLAEEVSHEIHSLTSLYRHRGQAFERLGDFPRARADISLTLQLARLEENYHLEWQALIYLGRLWASRDYQKTRACFEQALDLSRRMDEPVVLAGSLNWMGNWHTNAEDPNKAADYHTEALLILEKIKDQKELANTLDLLGITHLMGGDLCASLEYYDQAIDLFREMDDRLRLVSCLTGRAAVVSMRAFLASASPDRSPDGFSDSDEALRLSREIGSASGESWAHWALGMLQLVKGKYGQAPIVLREGIRIASEIGHQEYVVGNGFALGITLQETGQPLQAKEQLEETLKLAKELRSPTMVHLTVGALAGAYLNFGDLIRARASLSSVLSPRTPMDTLGKRYCWVRQAELALAEEEPNQSIKITERLISTVPGLEKDKVITYLWKLKGEALAEMGQHQESIQLLRNAIDNARALDEQFLLWRLHSSLARSYRAVNMQSEAEKDFQIARDLVEGLAGNIDQKVERDVFLSYALAQI